MSLSKFWDDPTTCNLRVRRTKIILLQPHYFIAERMLYWFLRVTSNERTTIGETYQVHWHLYCSWLRYTATNLNSNFSPGYARTSHSRWRLITTVRSSYCHQTSNHTQNRRKCFVVQQLMSRCASYILLIVSNSPMQPRISLELAPAAKSD